MKMFIEELVEAFPGDTSFVSALYTFEDLVSANYKKPSQMFMELFAQHAQLIADKNESMFDAIGFPNIDFKKLWKKDISNSTKDAIWAYLSQLLILAASS
jgi:hypothetical protein